MLINMIIRFKNISDKAWLYIFFRPEATISNLPINIISSEAYILNGEKTTDAQAIWVQMLFSLF